MARKNFWSVFFVILFTSLAINIGQNQTYTGFQGRGLAQGFAAIGVPLVILGQVNVFHDRKKGDYWMQHNLQVNPNPNVYSLGEPLFMTGWIFCSIAMSLHY